jgi:hypothetical protein
MKAKGNFFLQNVKTRWITIFSLAKQVMFMYMPLIAKMAKDNAFFMVAKVNFELFYDVNLLVSLSCMLEIVHALIKFAQK